MSLRFWKSAFPGFSAAQTACVNTRPTSDTAPAHECAHLPTGVLPSDGRLSSVRGNKKGRTARKSGTVPAS